jgi:hypothetical protein
MIGGQHGDPEPLAEIAQNIRKPKQANGESKPGEVEIRWRRLVAA